MAEMMTDARFDELRANAGIGGLISDNDVRELLREVHRLRAPVVVRECEKCGRPIPTSRLCRACVRRTGD